MVLLLPVTAALVLLAVWCQVVVASFGWLQLHLSRRVTPYEYPPPLQRCELPHHHPGLLQHCPARQSTRPEPLDA